VGSAFAALRAAIQRGEKREIRVAEEERGGVEGEREGDM
jgi:hypothetical protein